MNVNTMQHLSDEGLTKSQGLASARVRNVRRMVQPLLRFHQSGNALVVGMMTFKLYGNLVELQLLQL